jgi:hypothetical protein
MGCRRAGWYSYDGLDNGGTPNANRIVPARQHVAIGDLLAWTPTADDGFIVRAFEPERSLVLGGTRWLVVSHDVGVRPRRHGIGRVRYCT